MIAACKRIAIQLEDAVRYNQPLRTALGRCRVFADMLARSTEPQAQAKQIARLCGAARLTSNTKLTRNIEHRLRTRIDRLDLSKVTWDEFVPGATNRRITKGVIVKPWVSAREKGVVFISFEDQWAKLLTGCNLVAFSQRYDVVVAPTWCPPHSLVNVAFPAAFPAPIFCLMSNARDQDIFPRLSTKYIMVPLYASSWVNPRFYSPRPRSERDIDIVMVANFGKYKRHHVLFRALRMVDARAVLIGQGQGSRSAETILREAALFGVADRISVHSSVSNKLLADALCRAKVSLIVCRREGSCVAVAESMFADTPVGLLTDAEVGSRAFIHESTGRLLREPHLAEDLSAFLQASPGLSPRAWAERNISCHQSTHVLNDALKCHAIARGDSWTRDIEVVYWRPDPQVECADADGRLRGEYAYIEDHFGLQIGSHRSKQDAEC